MRQEKRIKRLRNRLRRARIKLYAWRRSAPHKHRLRALVGAACLGDVEPPFDELVKRVTKALDKLVEPRNPFLEWATDVGFDIAAHVAVAIYLNTEDRIERRIAELEAELAELEQQQ